MTTTINPDLSAAGKVEIVPGSVADWPLIGGNADGTTMSFAAGDTVTAVVFGGAGQSVLFAPLAVWTGGSGYLTGQVTVSPTSAQSLMLEFGADYQLQVLWTSADASRTACILRRRVVVRPAPGTATEVIVPYCQLSDMLFYASWLDQVSGQDSDLEGFYSQRIQARKWMDWAITNCYRGASVGNFEQMSTLAFAFGGGVGWRRGTGPSPSLVQWLQQNLLIIRPQIVEACTYKAISLVGLNQMGNNPQHVAFGCYFRDMAERVMTATTAELDLNNDGIGEIFVNLGSTNTLMT